MSNDRDQGVASTVVTTFSTKLPPPLSFKLPFPPSMNGLYGINFRTRSVYLTNDARYWKSKAKLLIPRFDCKPDCKVYLNMDVRNEWYFKNGKQKKSDVQNLVKVVVDAVSEKCGFDDSQVWSFSCNKIQSNEQSVQITMGVIDEAWSKERFQGEIGTGEKDTSLEVNKQDA
jgi:Holliday junction resolvase RusA-like endonuclease